MQELLDNALHLADLRALKVWSLLAPVPADFFAARGAGTVSLEMSASLVTGLEAALGLPPNRKPKASQGLTLDSSVVVSSFCVACGFLTAPRGDWYYLADATASVEGVLALIVAGVVCGVHILFAGAATRGGWIWSLGTFLRYFLSSSRVFCLFFCLTLSLST